MPFGASLSLSRKSNAAMGSDTKNHEEQRLNEVLSLLDIDSLAEVKRDEVRKELSFTVPNEEQQSAENSNNTCSFGLNYFDQEQYEEEDEEVVVQKNDSVEEESLKDLDEFNRGGITHEDMGITMNNSRLIFNDQATDQRRNEGQLVDDDVQRVNTMQQDLIATEDDLDMPDFTDHATAVNRVRRQTLDASMSDKVKELFGVYGTLGNKTTYSRKEKSTARELVQEEDQFMSADKYDRKLTLQFQMTDSGSKPEGYHHRRKTTMGASKIKVQMHSETKTSQQLRGGPNTGRVGGSLLKPNRRPFAMQDSVSSIQERGGESTRRRVSFIGDVTTPAAKRSQSNAFRQAGLHSVHGSNHEQSFLVSLEENNNPPELNHDRASSPLMSIGGATNQPTNLRRVFSQRLDPPLLANHSDIRVDDGNDEDSMVEIYKLIRKTQEESVAGGLDYRASSMALSVRENDNSLMEQDKTVQSRTGRSISQRRIDESQFMSAGKGITGRGNRLASQPATAEASSVQETDDQNSHKVD